MSPAILAATDLSPRSAEVAGRAAALAGVLGARLILAHVIEGPALAATGRGMRPLLTRLGLAPPPEDADAGLRAAAEGLAVPVETRLLRGAAEEELARLAAESGAVLLVLGLHRERGVLDLLRLTTMERIVLAADVPVLIAHQPWARPYRKVLSLTDFSPGAAAALRMAARIAPGASFHAVHALKVPLAVGGEDITDQARLVAEMTRRGWLASPDLPDLNEPPELIPGGLHEVLDFRRRELGADLVCIGTHSGRDPGALGNYARDLMRAPPTDLLIAKPG